MLDFSMPRGLLLCLLLPLIYGKSPDQTVLNEWPMIMVHDAATTYLEGGFFHQINNWAKTQPDGGTRGELNCGARAFDWRPSVQSDGTVKMHHGDITVDHPMADSLDEMVSWCAANGTDPADLVVLGITDCEGTDCVEAVTKLLKARNIPHISDCSQLNNVTVSDAFTHSGLPGGGAILAIFNCWEEHYDPSVACSGFGSTEEATPGAHELLGRAAVAQATAKAHNLQNQTEESATYSCYSDSSSRDFPVNRMVKYINSTAQGGPPTDGQLYTVQCLWQESASSITVGELHGSTLLDDESRSGLNLMVTDLIKKKEIDTSRLNMIEVNNVCNNGLELLAALRAIE